MSISKHNPKKCDSDQMVKEGCESSINEVIRKFCEDVERRKVLIGVLAQLNEQPREA